MDNTAVLTVLIDGKRRAQGHYRRDQIGLVAEALKALFAHCRGHRVAAIAKGEDGIAHIVRAENYR